MEDKNIFVTLNSINVSDHTEKKNGLTYLSWAWAWGELKTVHPDATYTVYERQDGRIYWDDGRTCWVKVGVTVNGLEHIEYLPVMNHRNQSIPVDQVTSMDINKSIQRCLTKAIARHGLGLYIYAGEDMPEDEGEDKAAQRIQPQKQKAQMLQYNPYDAQKPRVVASTDALPDGRTIEQIYTDEGRDGLVKLYKATTDNAIKDAITKYMNDRKKENA